RAEDRKATGGERGEACAITELARTLAHTKRTHQISRQGRTTLLNRRRTACHPAMMAETHETAMTEDKRFRARTADCRSTPAWTASIQQVLGTHGGKGFDARSEEHT